MDHDKKIEILYNQVVEKRKQAMEHPEKKLSSSQQLTVDLGVRLENTHENLYQIFANPKIPRAVFDKMQKDFVKLLDKTIMYLDPGVIKVLMDEEIMAQAKKKMLENLD